MILRISRLAIVGLALGLLLESAPARAQESWDAIYLGAAKVGYVHVWIKPVKDAAGHELVNVRVEWDLALKRGRDRVELKQQYGTIEQPDGSILRLDTRTRAAQGDLRTFGDVKDGVMKLTIQSGKATQQKDIPWGPEVRGPYASELSLARKPMAADEVRSIQTYIPDLNKVCVTRLTAQGKEDVAVGSKGEMRSLLKVEQVVLDEGKPVAGMASTLWVDDKGQILKSFTDMLGGMTTFRTTKAAALGDGGGAEFDLLARSIVRVPRPIPNADKTRDVVYRIRMEKEEPAEVFIKDRRQSASPSDDKSTATIEVKTAGPDAPGTDAVPAAEFLRANPLINSEDPLVVRHMTKAVKGQTDPWARASAIQKWVSDSLVDKNFGVAFAPAAEVARDLRGDCSEHSVLVAAMCRAAGIPARCVVGLVYAENLGGFGPHMWNEVYVNGRWVAIDAAYNQSDVDATHLKLAATSMDGVAPFEAFLPVLKVFDKIKIEPIEIR